MDEREFINRARAAVYEAARSTQSGVGRYADTAPRPQRPRPRQMRDPAIRAVDPQLAPSERQRAERQMYDAAQGPSRAEMTAPAYAAPRNQFAEAGQGALELTGLPSVRRSARAFAQGDLRTGAEEGAMGALGVLGMATLAPARGALNRAPVRPAGALPMDEASRMARARAMGFDVETPLYHGTSSEFPDFRISTGIDAWHGDGIYATPNPEMASIYARMRGIAHEADDLPTPNAWPNVLPIFARNARDVGPNGVVISDPRNVRSRFAAFDPDRADSPDLLAGTPDMAADPMVGALRPGRRPSGRPPSRQAPNEDRYLFGRPPVGEPAMPLPQNPARPPARASDGSVLPVREPEPFRNSLRGGSDDLAEATQPQGALRPPSRPAAGGEGADDFTVGPLYHGTRAPPFERFSPDRVGSNAASRDIEAYYFANDPAIAEKWAGLRLERAGLRPPGGRVIEAQARLRNPLVVEGDGSIQYDGLPEDVIARARDAGHDGVIFRNFDDGGEGVGDYTVVFSPDNIRMGAPRPSPGGAMREPIRRVREIDEGHEGAVYEFENQSGRYSLEIERVEGDTYGVVFDRLGESQFRPTGDATVGGARQTFRNAMQAIRQDAATYGRPRYQLYGFEGGQQRIYERLAQSESLPGYSIRVDGRNIVIERSQ